MDISHNPIRVLTKESFYRLHRLQDLTVQHLANLTRFDADSLAQLPYLTNLRIQSWPSIERFKFRLGSVVSGISSLRRLSARILEPSGVLADQGKALFSKCVESPPAPPPPHFVVLVQQFELQEV